jgi:hypothetical protein
MGLKPGTTINTEPNPGRRMAVLETRLKTNGLMNQSRVYLTRLKNALGQIVR